MAERIVASSGHGYNNGIPGSVTWIYSVAAEPERVCAWSVAYQWRQDPTTDTPASCAHASQDTCCRFPTHHARWRVRSPFRTGHCYLQKHYKEVINTSDPYRLLSLHTSFLCLTIHVLHPHSSLLSHPHICLSVRARNLIPTLTFIIPTWHFIFISAKK